MIMATDSSNLVSFSATATDTVPNNRLLVFLFIVSSEGATNIAVNFSSKILAA